VSGSSPTSFVDSPGARLAIYEEGPVDNPVFLRGPLGKTGLHNKALQLSKRGGGICPRSAIVINVRLAGDRQAFGGHRLGRDGGP
jgi:hypothetical protein